MTILEIRGDYASLYVRDVPMGVRRTTGVFPDSLPWGEPLFEKMGPGDDRRGIWVCLVRLADIGGRPLVDEGPYSL